MKRQQRMNGAQIERARAVMRGEWRDARAHVTLTINATATDIAQMPEPQRNAFMRGVGLVMAAAHEGRAFGERVASDGGAE